MIARTFTIGGALGVLLASPLLNAASSSVGDSDVLPPASPEATSPSGLAAGSGAPAVRAPLLQLGLAVESPAPESSSNLLSADFDGDGWLDLATFAQGGDIYVALNPGRGDLSSWPWELVASVPYGGSDAYWGGMLAADADGDGLPDILVYGRPSDGSAPNTCGADVVQNLGAGNFAAGSQLRIIPGLADDFVYGCASADVGDFDSDGTPDIAVSYSFQPIDWYNGMLGAVNVFLGTGAGTFGPPANYSLADSSAPYVSFAMTSGDFNGDGLRDLGFGSEVRWISGPAAYRVEALLGDGAGGFVSGPTRAFDCNYCEIFFVSAADLDGDGRDDLVIPAWNPSLFSYYYPLLAFHGQADGGFSAGEDLMPHQGTSTSLARDVTGDHIPDVLLLGDRDQVTLLEGLDGGGFAAPQRFVTGVGAGNGTLADLDGDGESELVMLGGAGLAIVRGAPSPDAFVLPRASSDGGYIDSISPPADFDGDGNLDVLAIQYGQLELMLGTGDGRFLPGAITPTSTFNAWRMPFADLDQDGHLDTVQATGDGFAVFRGTAGGHFEPIVPVEDSRTILAAAIGDIDADGHTDLAAYEWPGESVDIYLSDGALGFNRVASIETSPYVDHVILEDLNSDGHLDLLLSAYNYETAPDGTRAEPVIAQILFGDGRAGFALGATLGVRASPLLVRDVDGDGALDILSPDVLFRGDGAGHFEAARALPSAGARQIELADLDGDGQLDLVFLGAGLHVARGTSGGEFEPSQRLTSASGWQSFHLGQFTGSAAPDVLALQSFAFEFGDGSALSVAENTAQVCGGSPR